MNLQILGHWRNTILRVLSRRRELTEPHCFFGQTRWVLRKTRWVRFITQIIGWGELTELSPRDSVRAKKHWVRCLKPTSRNRIRPVSEIQSISSTGATCRVSATTTSRTQSTTTTWIQSILHVYINLVTTRGMTSLLNILKLKTSSWPLGFSDFQQFSAKSATPKAFYFQNQLKNSEDHVQLFRFSFSRLLRPDDHIHSDKSAD